MRFDSMYFHFLTGEQNKILDKSIRAFHGHAPTLESALGAMVMGHMWGWRFLKLIHSPVTYKNYEKILGLQFQDFCQERGELANKSYGMRIADKLNSFWAVATGKRKIKDKARIDDEKQIEKELKDVN